MADEQRGRVEDLMARVKAMVTFGNELLAEAKAVPSDGGSLYFVDNHLGVRVHRAVSIVGPFYEHMAIKVDPPRFYVGKLPNRKVDSLDAAGALLDALLPFSEAQVEHLRDPTAALQTVLEMLVDVHSYLGVICRGREAYEAEVVKRSERLRSAKRDLAAYAREHKSRGCGDAVWPKRARPQEAPTAEDAEAIEYMGPPPRL
jgi:hypothetical protein